MAKDIILDPSALRFSFREAADCVLEAWSREVHRLLLDRTFAAIRGVQHPRFWRTERGFHGEFHSILRQILLHEGVVRKRGPLLEQEYQKSFARQGTPQRPDTLLHIPADDSGLPCEIGNYCVWALKRRASGQEADNDFRKLQKMFERLKYPLGVFLNVDAEQTFHSRFPHRFSERLHCVACFANAIEW
jgi:hypothetical protein